MGKQLQYTYCQISQSKGNHTMKCGQLLKYNIKNVFSCKIMHKMCWRSQSQTLSKNQN